MEVKLEITLQNPGWYGTIEGVIINSNTSIGITKFSYTGNMEIVNYANIQCLRLTYTFETVDNIANETYLLGVMYKIARSIRYLRNALVKINDWTELDNFEPARLNYLNTLSGVKNDSN